MKFDPSGKWTAERANAWWDKQTWICGFNFLPSTAVNFLEMWSAETFDKSAIESELTWAAKIGYNSVRTNLHYLIWQHDREGLLERLDWFLEVADRLGLRTMPVLFDDCGFGVAEPKYGRQPDPIEGIHNSRAVASPGRAAVMNRQNWPDFKRYVKGILHAFAADPRVLIWDLYNEPGNSMQFPETGVLSEYDPALEPHSLDLMISCFTWAREVGTEAPLTVGAWKTQGNSNNAVAYANENDRTALELSDIVTFHAYRESSAVEKIIEQLTLMGRPMLNTEWMARKIGSTVPDQLALYKEHKVGCYNWGLVRGRTQTFLPWPHVSGEQGKSDPEEWFHDILDADGTPYDKAETDLIKSLTETR